MRRFVLNNVVLLIQYAVSALVSVLLVPHIVRAIGLAQFGKLALALSIASYGAQTVQYAFQLTGPRHLMQLPPGERAGDVVSRIASAKLVLWGIVLGVAFVAAGLTRLTGSWLTPAQTRSIVVLSLARLPWASRRIAFTRER